MQATMLPSSIYQEIEKICKRFIWGMNEGRDKIHLINWKTLCHSREEDVWGSKRWVWLIRLLWWKQHGVSSIHDKDSIWASVLGGKSIKSQDHVPRVKANEKDSALWKTWTICIYSIPSLPWKTWTLGFGPLYLLNKCLLRVYDKENNRKASKAKQGGSGYQWPRDKIPTKKVK
jgi:hypothetical protein